MKTEFVNIRVIEEVIELADNLNNPIVYEQLSRYVRGGDMEGVWQLLKELRSQE